MNKQSKIIAVTGSITIILWLLVNIYDYIAWRLSDLYPNIVPSSLLINILDDSCVPAKIGWLTITVFGIIFTTYLIFFKRKIQPDIFSGVSMAVFNFFMLTVVFGGFYDIVFAFMPLYPEWIALNFSIILKSALAGCLIYVTLLCWINSLIQNHKKDFKHILSFNAIILDVVITASTLLTILCYLKYGN
jgi:hypothetical protein